jgi:hypothetical protein
MKRPAYMASVTQCIEMTEGIVGCRNRFMQKLANARSVRVRELTGSWNIQSCQVVNAIL